MLGENKRIRIVEILQQAEVDAGLVEMARERAAHGGWAKPEEPGDYLTWWIDKLNIQSDTLEAHPEQDQTTQ